MNDPTPDQPDLPDLDRIPAAGNADLERELQSLHLPATDPDDPRLAIPSVLKEPDYRTRPRVKESDNEGVAASLAGAGKAWAIAFEFIVTILLGVGGGWLFDRWRGTSPTGSLIGMGCGFVLAFYRIVRATQAQERAEARQRQKRP